MFDTCVNLHSEQYSADPWSVVKRGFEAGLTGMGLTGSCLESTRLAIAMAKKDPDRANSEKGYVNFVHVELSIIDLDILQLHHDGHIRFQVVGEDLSYVAP